ncbi:protein ASPARTIC PROTEASE IN GUARD CELL 2-like [Hibiscus syriacus]|uniref:Protein ASPARTIC PROTEASE IN GUARD CELL 2-like n=1 Tax=Hibiscus syriacus TaxID=106335 RepID=A0A6A3CYT3_HIBSY|nr:protein ASPARTIC PROTEASE IN GUARD CELL 2-like [Hibiscus syriacus]
MSNYSLLLLKQHLLFPVTNARAPECRYAGSFCNKDVDLVLVAAYHMVSVASSTSEFNIYMSTGVDVPLSSLIKYAPTMWEPSMVGSRLGRLCSGTIEALHSAELGIEALTLSEYAQMSDDEESELSSKKSDSSDYEEISPRGIGFLESTARQRGYREGMGLGASGQEMLDPISVKVLPPKLSLDHALESRENDEGKEKKGMKRSRGGKRKREKKFAEAARAAKEEEESRPDVFSLINNQLAMHNEAVNGGSTRKQQKKGSGEGKKVDRKALVGYDDEVKELKFRVVKLEEMVSRNRNEKAVYDAAMRKLNETRKALAEAEAEAVHESASNAVASKEKEKVAKVLILCKRNIVQLANYALFGDRFYPHKKERK